MKRLIKVFAFLGSLGVIGWLIRNRFVGVTWNREPQAPEPAPEPLPDSDLFRLPGITQAEVDLLQGVGISTVDHLVGADASNIAEQTGLDQDRLSALKEQATALV